jgi:hypothetical protein
MFGCLAYGVALWLIAGIATVRRADRLEATVRQ